MYSATLQITQGNLDHHHLYLTKIMDLFPRSSIGGGSKATRAHRLLKLRPHGLDPVLTDIDGDKKIFRSRGWVRKFFALHRIVAGDKVVVRCLGVDEFRIEPA